MNTEQYYFEIQKRFGNIRRARGHFLYTQKNIRLTDLYREEGRAILGWNSKAFSVLKNALSKNLTGSFVTAQRERLKNAVSQLLRSNREIFVFSKKQDALNACFVISNLQKKIEDCAMATKTNELCESEITESNSDKKKCSEAVFKNSSDCANLNADEYANCSAFFNDKTNQQKNDIAFFKPFSKHANKKPLDFSKTNCVLLCPPLAWTKNVFIVAALSENHEEKNTAPHYDFALKQRSLFSETLPPVLEAAFSRSIFDLISAQKNLQEKDFFCYDAVLQKYWTREGPYLWPKIPCAKYDDFVLHCLERNLAISPEYEVSSIVPFGVEAGVFKKLKNSPFEF